VAWIAQRKNLLAMLFGLVAVWGWMKGEKREARGEGRNGWNRWHWVGLVAFLLAMLSKGAVGFLPGVLLLIAWWERGTITKRDWLRAAPFFLVAVVMVGVNIWSQQHAGVEPIRSVSFAQRLAGAGAVIWFYLAKGVLPVDLSFIYPQWEIDARNVLWWLPLVAAAAVTGALIWQRQRAWCRAVLFGWGYFCFALVPVMGFTDVYYMKYSLVADHYQYFAIVGVVALVAAGWVVLQERAGAAARGLIIVSGSLVVAALMMLSWRQCALYRDPVKLYEQSLEMNPGSWIVHNDLAKILNDTDRPVEAQQQLLEAAKLSPEHVQIHLNLGTAALKQGKLDEAARHYEEAVRIEPKYPEAHFALGSVLAQLGKVQEAVEQYREAVRLEPEYTNAHLALGAGLSSSGKASESVKEFEEVVREQPEFTVGRL
jgi:protein O-mannosyl-transferase